MSPPLNGLRCGACSWSGFDAGDFHSHLTGHSLSGSYFFHGPTSTGHPQPDPGSSGDKPDDTFLNFNVTNTNNPVSIVKTEPTSDFENSFDDEPTLDDSGNIQAAVNNLLSAFEEETLDNVIASYTPGLNQSNVGNNEESNEFNLLSKSPLENIETKPKKRGRKKSSKLKGDDKSNKMVKLGDKTIYFLKVKKIGRKRKSQKADAEDRGEITDNEVATASKKVKTEDDPVHDQDSHIKQEVEDVELQNMDQKDKHVVKKEKSKPKRTPPTNSPRFQTVIPCHLCLIIVRHDLMYSHVEQAHEGEYRWKCTTCLLPFITQDAYDDHMSWCKNSWNKSHACIDCNNERLFLSREKLVSHINHQHNRKFPLECSICKEPIASKFDEECHMTKHDKTKLLCRFCKFECKSITQREQHTMKHVKNEDTCYICERVFTGPVHTRSHVFKHLDQDGNYICDKCGRGFGNMTVLTNHKRLCEKKYGCSYCEKKFARQTGLKVHVSSAHIEKGTYVCDQCGSTFSNKQALKNHIRYAHSITRQFKCQLCGKDFKEKASYERHLLIHEQKHPFSCEYCDKPFRTKWNLTAHTRQHTGEKPYSCSKCGMAFTHNVVRKGHEANCQGV